MTVTDHDRPQSAKWHSGLGGFLLREWPYLLILVLSLFGVAYTSFSQTSIYWVILAPLVGIRNAFLVASGVYAVAFVLLSVLYTEPAASTKAASAERERVSTIDNPISSTAPEVAIRAPNRGELTRSMRPLRPPGADRIVATSESKNAASPTGKSISIQPAKWFGFTNGPKGRDSNVGFQNP